MRVCVHRCLCVISKFRKGRSYFSFQLKERPSAGPRRNFRTESNPERLKLRIALFHKASYPLAELFKLRSDSVNGLFEVYIQFTQIELLANHFRPVCKPKFLRHGLQMVCDKRIG